jgi:hypothetical protein
MSRSEPDATRIVRLWLEEGVTALPDHVLDTVLDQLPATPQRRPTWLARRSPTMNKFVTIGLAAAAVVVATLLGYQLLIAPNIGGPGPSPIPSETPLPSPAAIHRGALEPGTYTAVDFPNGASDIAFQFTVPSGWIWNDWYLSKSTGTGPPQGLGIGFMTGMSQDDFVVYTDPCNWLESEPDPRTGPTAEDFVRALAAQPGRNATEPTERRGNAPEGTGMWPGWTVTVEVPDDIVISECDGGQYRSWGPEPNERFHQGPGQRDEVWVTEQPVGPVRLVVFATSFPGTPEADISEMEAIVESTVSTDTH